jgi:organic hydroperoxide reductase OsmC/OhrA
METVACVFETEIEWAGGRERTVRAYVLRRLRLNTPVVLPGSDGEWTPEHLFVAWVNSRFIAIFRAFAEDAGLEVRAFECSSLSKLERRKEAGFRLAEITLNPRLVVRNSSEARQAMRLFEKAEKECLASNTTDASPVQPAVVFQVHASERAAVS